MSDDATPENVDSLQPAAPESPVSESAPAAQPAAPGIESAQILEELVQGRLDLELKLKQIDNRLQGLETALETVTRQVSFLPPQVRGLSSKVEGVGSLIADSRYQTLLLRLLSFYDLVNQMSNVPAQDGNGQAAGPVDAILVLKTQLCQILEANGLSEIEAAGAFNPELHRSMQQVPCADPAQAGQIVDVIRPGFRTERSVLRFAEVSVGVYTPIKSDPV
jgi:molecular chaperone GrpE (heat shock protein)